MVSSRSVESCKIWPLIMLAISLSFPLFALLQRQGPPWDSLNTHAKLCLWTLHWLILCLECPSLKYPRKPASLPLNLCSDATFLMKPTPINLLRSTPLYPLLPIFLPYFMTWCWWKSSILENLSILENWARWSPEWQAGGHCEVGTAAPRSSRDPCSSLGVQGGGLSFAEGWRMAPSQKKPSELLKLLLIMKKK